MKAFIFDPLWDELVTNELLAKLKSSNLDIVVTKEIAPLSECSALFEGDEDRVLCLNPDYVSWKLTSDDYRNIPNLRGILIAATGYNWIDKQFANDNNIPVCQIKNFSTEAVAEWALTMMFNVARQVPCLIKNDFPLDFDKDFMKYRGVELHGKTVGIIGLGHIGKAIADRCAGLGMNVIYWSKSSKESKYKYKELPELFGESDFVFPTMSVNDESKTIITNELIDSMKPTATLIAIEHHLFDKEKVLENVKNGLLFGFGFEAEPASFAKYEGNVWAAPTYAWATDQTMFNSVDKLVENMIDASSGKFPNRVNQN